MKEFLISLLQKYQNKDTGIIINGDLIVYTEKLLAKSIIYNVFEQGKLIGFIAFYANNVLEKKAFLSMLLVEEGYRSKRVGSILIKSAIEHLGNIGFIEFELQVLDTNTKAINFYHRHGFKIIDHRDNYYLMALNLNIAERNR